MSNSPVRKALSAGQAAELIAVCTGEQERLVVRTLLETGLRAPQFSRLDASALNWEDGTLLVPGAQRFVGLSQDLLRMLREYFATRRKVRLGNRQIQRIVRAAGRKAGLNMVVTPDVLHRTWREQSAGSKPCAERSERVLEAAADAAIDVILIVDDERRFVDFNRSAAAVLGLPREEIIGRRIEEFFSEAHGKPVRPAWSTFAVEGEQWGVCELNSVKRRTFEYRAKAHFKRGLHLSVLREISADSTSAERSG